MANSPSQSKYGNPANYNVTPATRTDGDASALEVDVNGNLKVTGGGASSADQSAFTAGTTPGTISQGVYQVTPTTLTNNQAAAIGVDANRNVKVTLATEIAGEDLTNNVLKVEQRFSYAAISTATTTTIKSGAGFIHTLNIVGGTLGAITVYDNTAGSGTTIIPTFTPTATLPCPSIVLDQTFATGLTIVTAAATIINVGYR